VAQPPVSDPEDGQRSPADRAAAARERANARIGGARDRAEVVRDRAEGVRGRLEERAEKARMSTRRKLGIDRSGPPPPETLKGHPLNPWTLPNAIGFVRLALIPVFVVVALGSGDGRDALAATLFAVIGWSDYLDGLTARLTGQYSRLGAMLDPFVDRLLVVSGVIVVYHFELLPRWALIVLVVRELSMLVISFYGLRRGLDIKINWPGRLGVAPVMGSLFFPMTGLLKLGEIMLYVGLALAITATVLYVRDGLSQARSAPAAG
jgi:cardiolipin synthase